MRIPHSPHFEQAICPVRRSNQPDTNLCVLIANYCICIYRLNNQDCICIFVYLQICRRANMRNSFSQQLGLGNIQIPIMTQIFVASTCDQLVKFATKHMFPCSVLKQLPFPHSSSNFAPKNGMLCLPCHSPFLNNKLGIVGHLGHLHLNSCHKVRSLFLCSSSRHSM